MTGRAAVAFCLILAVSTSGEAQGLLTPAASSGDALGRGRRQDFAAPDPAAGRGASAALDWGWIGRPAAPSPPRRWQREKSPRVAMISSFLVPGLGQMYNEREFWAAVAAGVEFYFIGQWIVEQRLTNRYRAIVDSDPEDQEALVRFELHRDNRIQAQWMYGLTALISGLQALVDAYLFDFDDTPLPVQPVTTPSGGGGAMLEFRF